MTFHSAIRMFISATSLCNMPSREFVFMSYSLVDLTYDFTQGLSLNLSRIWLESNQLLCRSYQDSLICSIRFWNPSAMSIQLSLRKPGRSSMRTGRREFWPQSTTKQFSRERRIPSAADSDSWSRVRPQSQPKYWPSSWSCWALIFEKAMAKPRQPQLPSSLRKVRSVLVTSVGLQELSSLS
mgnify:CR=1 FL=1